MADLTDLVHEHALLTMEKQLHAADVIAERPFEADLDRGTITFGGQLEMGAQLLGSQATNPASWLWSWANPSGFPAAVVASAERLRELGAEESIDAFVESELPVSPTVDADRVAIAAVGVLEAPAYFSLPAGGGTRVVLLIEHPELALPPPQSRPPGNGAHDHGAGDRHHRLADGDRVVCEPAGRALRPAERPSRAGRHADHARRRGSVG